MPTVPYNPIKLYTDQFKAILAQAQATDNPAQYLYHKGARNVLFMLEALTRLHEPIITQPKLEQWQGRFKLLEDLLGELDYVDNYNQQLANKKGIPAKQIQVLESRCKGIEDNINTILLTKKWVLNHLAKFEAFIAKQNLVFDVAYTHAIAASYTKEVDKVNAYIQFINGNYTQLEEQVHEVRRKLRWLSIYAQCMQGLFTLHKPKATPAWSKKYMTKAVVSSPYNKLAKAPKSLSTIPLNYYAFVTLSYTIDALGAIKDTGLLSHLLQQELGYTTPQVSKLLGKAYVTESALLSKASTLLQGVTKARVLQQLVVG